MLASYAILSRFTNRLFGRSRIARPRRHVSRCSRRPAFRSVFGAAEILEARALLSASSIGELCNSQGAGDAVGALAQGQQAQCSAEHGSTDFTLEVTPAAVTGGASSATVTGGAVYPLSSLPVLHSNPTASVKLFLDFDGDFQAVWGSYTNVTTPAYDIDGDPTTFNDRELANIQSNWAVVAEDFAPFNIDVTTEQPPVLADGMPIDAANGVALRVAIGGTSDWYVPGSTGYAGISYFNSFTNSIANVSYVFGQNRDYPLFLGDFSSHEAGHAFGLDHQNTSYTATWQPIMYAAGGVRSFATWTSGINAGGTFQDDMAMIASTTNGITYRADDFGSTIATATPLASSGGMWTGSGIVGTNSDMDMFSFTITATDSYRIAVNGDATDADLDAAFDLRDSSGQLLASANPQDSLNAQLVTPLTPGTYYLAVKSSGTYGWIGQYHINIDAPPAGITVSPASPTMTTGEDGRTTSVSVVLQTAPVANVTIPVSSTNTAEGTVSTSSLVFTSANWNIPQVVTVTGVDDSNVDGDQAYSIVLGAAVSADPEYNGMDPADLSVVNVDNDEAGFVYSVDSKGAAINRSRLGGTQAETLVDLKALFGTTGSYAPREMAIDQAAGKIYWTDASQKAIRRADLDGSNVETLVTSTTASFRGIALDTTAGKMYWIDNVALKIQRANLDGTQVQDVVTNSAGFYAMGLAIDPSAGKLYWTDFGGSSLNAVRRANLDGSNIEVVWTSTDALSPTGIALDLAGGKVYWSDQTQDVIRRANLDGTNPEVVVNTGALVGNSQVFGLALDVPAGKIYWTDNATKGIYRANLDGSMVANLGTSTSAGLEGLVIAHPAAGISVTHRTGLTTSEAGASSYFRVALTTQPTANVTFAVSTNDTTEGVASVSSVTFTPTNWNVAQTITVTGVDDAIVDGNVAYTIVLSPATSTDPLYNGVNPPDVSLTNTDNEVTRFYVVNDGTSDRTYEYTAGGLPVENYAINSGDTAPRGAAGSAAGTTVWVVDANRNVYVYNTSGGLLGSWSASNFNSTAQLEGIATNGTDVWILDNKSDKVYRYTSAATRLSGSQSAASSFSLNGSNSNGKGIVTDGTSIWVVDDGSTDKVFKYSLTGTLLGSWTISTSGATQPTGITINPTSVSDIWLVDAGSDKVYQYTGAATRTSGSQSAASSFALASGNTNPQDIADPPSGTGTPLLPTTFGGAPSNRALDSLFTQLAANFDLNGTGDEWSGSIRGRFAGRWKATRGNS